MEQTDPRLSASIPGRPGWSLIQKRYRLNSRHLKPFAAADVLAHHHIFAAHHVGLGLGELGAVALVGPRRKRFFLGTHQPGQLILVDLPAMRAVQGMGLFGFLLVKKITLVHPIYYQPQRTRRATKIFPHWVTENVRGGEAARGSLQTFLCVPSCPSWLNPLRAQEEKKEEVHRGQGGQVHGPHRDRRAASRAARREPEADREIEA